MSVSRDFFNLVTYGLFQALAQLYGKEGWKVPPAFGEIAFKELKKRLKLEGLKPIQVLNTLARYFEQAGYIDKIEFREVGENELIYSMEGVSIDWAVSKLKDEGGVLPHYSTYTCVAALRELFDIEAEMVDLAFGTRHGKFYAEEKWTLKKR
ncbi:MAG: hypothetical protein ACE5GD_05140 [Candidatus Geothermarchaeales archaeon]